MTPDPAALDELRTLLAELRQALKQPPLVMVQGEPADLDDVDARQEAASGLLERLRANPSP